MRKLTHHQLADACKTHIESAQAILQTFPYDNALVIELAEIWRDLDSMGRRSEQAARYYQQKKVKSVLTKQRDVVPEARQRRHNAVL